MEKEQNETLQDIIANLSEHHTNYAVVVMSEDDDSIHCAYNNFRIGRMLLNDALAEMNSINSIDHFEWIEINNEEGE